MVTQSQLVAGVHNVSERQCKGTVFKMGHNFLPGSILFGVRKTCRGWKGVGGPFHSKVRLSKGRGVVGIEM